MCIFLLNTDQILTYLLFHMVIYGLHSAYTDFLILPSAGSEMLVMGANHSMFPVFSPQISQGTNLELCQLWLTLQNHTIEPCSLANNQWWQDLNLCTQDFKPNILVLFPRSYLGESGEELWRLKTLTDKIFVQIVITPQNNCYQHILMRL